MRLGRQNVVARMWSPVRSAREAGASFPSKTAIRIHPVALVVAVLVVSSGAPAVPYDAPQQGSARLARSDNGLLDDISRRAFRYFW